MDRWSQFCLALDKPGRVVDWDCDAANVHDTAFHTLLEQFDEQMVILGDTGFHSADRDPPNLKFCRRGEWNECMGVETVLSMLTVVWHIKKMRHRVWDYFKTRLGYLMAAFNILTQWDGLKPDQQSLVRLPIAQFTL